MSYNSNQMQTAREERANARNGKTVSGVFLFADTYPQFDE
ncbi:MAG: hypothetical protein QG620_522 [Patescibacteria group bacterium]|nr:hypothetical protein [Patescibacteria group bacterium]